VFDFISFKLLRRDVTLSTFIKILGLNMFLVPQVLVKFGISPSSKLLTNLVLHLSKCVNLVLLTKFC